MNKVFINGLRVYAHHGVMPQERKVGSYFTIDIIVETDFTRAMLTDQLDGTISYADVFDIVKREMAVPSNLLEHVAHRISQAVLSQFPQAESVMLRIQKENPPMGAQCEGAGVELFAKRNTQ